MKTARNHGLLGFTLIEILVTVSILALITVVSIPNLRKFSQDQTLNDTASRLLRTLERARSSAFAKISCSNKPSTSWKVAFTSVDYTLKATCQDKNSYPLPVETSETFITEDYSAKNISISTNSGCPTGIPEIIFSGNDVSFKCGNGSLVSSTSLLITLSNNLGNSPVTISVNKGGAIYEVKP